MDTTCTYSATPEVPIPWEQGLILSFQTLTHFKPSARNSTVDEKAHTYSSVTFSSLPFSRGIRVINYCHTGKGGVLQLYTYKKLPSCAKRGGGKGNDNIT